MRSIISPQLGPRPVQHTRASRRAACEVFAFKSQMQQERRVKRAENVEGDFWVDSTCIDCDTCRWMAPATFTRANGMSAVTAQPAGHVERVRAMQALLSCPTYSIHTDSRTAQELSEAQVGLPALVPGVPGVFHCGWHDVKSYAATSYLIVRPPAQGGNILVDCPRYNPVLARNIAALGGVSHIFLTHKDDVGDHDKWARHFNALRTMHQSEVRAGTAGVEVQLRGEGPWALDGTPLPAPATASGSSSSSSSRGSSSHQGADGASSSSSSSQGASQIQFERQQEQPDVQLVFTPGHTEGHVCLYHAPTRTLFSGDHLSAPSDVHAPRSLHVFRDFNWHDFGLQLRSVEKLLQYDWVNVLPGHGRMAFLGTREARDAEVACLLAEHGYTTPSS